MEVGPEELRVSVVRGADRADLVVPAGVSVAELLPELVVRVGRREPLDPLGAVCLSVLGGPPLDPGAGLADQGVPDGSVLALTSLAPVVPPVDDDLTSVVAEVAEQVPRPAEGLARRATLAVAAALTGLGAVGVVASGGSLAAAVGAGTCLALLGLAVALAPSRGPVAVAAGWLAVGHAAAAGLAFGVAASGVAALLAGSAAAVACRRGRGAQLWAAAVAGLVLAAGGLLAGLGPVHVPVVLAGALVVLVVTGDLQPWLAALSVGLVPPPLGEQPPTPPDRRAVARRVRRAHEVMLVGSITTGVLLVVLAPVTVTLGPWGLAAALLCCTVVALRSRRQRVGAGGVLTLAGGLASLLPIAAAAWWQWPAGRPAVVAAAAAVGVVLLLAGTLPPPRTARAGRVAEVAEALALVSLPPVLLAATGLLDLVREVVG